MSHQQCLHSYVSGTVQGVCFRAATQKQAVQLGLTGWIRNLPDGRVEVMACGAQEKIAALWAWLQQGPRFAHVTHVSREELEWQSYDEFKIL